MSERSETEKLLRAATVAIATQRNEARAEIERLRSALRQIAMMPKAYKLVASICEIALAPSVGASSQ